MIIQTSRFGSLEIDGERLIRFPKGILGFPHSKEYALIQTGEQSAFYWLQAVDRPELAFVVCDPRLFIPDYHIPIKAEDLAEMGLGDVQEAQVFVIANRVGDQLTANLQGPLVINVPTRVGYQLVLSDRRFGTRHPLMKLPRSEERAVVSKTA
ncbi:MAG: flagellar assembly protein FliW [Phycisphaerales bacterium]|nr:MAG: flagellar assembly protein FliW [Phycisphaerales bacterium]